MDNDIIYFGRYEGWLRWLARGVRDGDKECIAKAAQLFDMMLPDDAIVIPMPSHNGEADRMLEVALCHPLGSRRVVADVLTCEPHPSSYEQKKAGLCPAPITMTVKEASVGYLKDAGCVFVIDNVIGTGCTAGAALAALHGRGIPAKVCTLAYSPR